MFCAMSLLIADLTIFSAIGWIAARNMLWVILLGFLCLRAFDKSVHMTPIFNTHTALALLLLLMSLLAAEGAIAICALIGAYAFTLDTRPMKVRLLHLLPFALLTVLWRVLSQSMGYGVSGIDLYIDPGQS